MTRKLQILRGTTAQNNAYTGAVGELTMDTDRNEVRIHDGQTVGGIKISDRNMPILTSMFFDHITNDMSWLRADTFSWQSGDVYVAAYEHLADEFRSLYIVASGDILGEEKTYYRDASKDTATTPINGRPLYAWTADDGSATYTTKLAPSAGDAALGNTGSPAGTITESTAKSDTIGDTTITYYLAEDGHKICLPDQESNLVALYESTGAADYYLLDTTNKQFKLPRKQKRTLIQAVKNTDGTWYNLYSDGWVEQGGLVGTGESVGVIFPIIMADTKYTALATPSGLETQAYTLTIGSRTNAQMEIACGGNVRNSQKTWRVDGYAAESAYASAGVRLEYYYVGNFEQSAIEQTAGLNTEMFNNLNAHKIIEFQAPNAANGYTWYRKYADGWVEQGGRLTMPATNAYSSSNVAITLPVPIKTPESAVLSYSGLNASENFANCENQASLSTTTATIGRWNNGNATAAARSYMWVLYGQAQ